MKSTNTDKTSERVAGILLDIGAVLFSRNRPFKFDSGILSPVYVDNRVLISYPKERKIVSGALTKKILSEFGKPDVVAGVATAGIPHAAWISNELKTPMVFVRSKPKDHGRGNQVEGSLKKGQKVVVVEDLVSTAGSSASVIKAISKMGAHVIGLISIYSHNLKEAKINLKKAKVRYVYLTDTKTVADEAVKKGYMKSEQVKVIEEWTKDPKSWGKKMGFE